MKVIRVVVDELPESCGDCVHGCHNGVNGRCSVFGIVTLPPKIIDVDIYETSRPDWCPLEDQGGFLIEDPEVAKMILNKEGAFYNKPKNENQDEGWDDGELVENDHIFKKYDPRPTPPEPGIEGR